MRKLFTRGWALALSPLLAAAVAAVLLGSPIRQVRIAEAVAPPNDDFPGITVAAVPYTDLETTTEATMEGSLEFPDPIPPLACIDPALEVRHDVWYTFTPSVTGQYTLSTQLSNYDTVIALYTGGNVGTLMDVPGGCDDQSGGSNTSLLNISLTAGTAYRIQVSAWNTGAGGSLVFSLTHRDIVVNSAADPGTGGCTVGECTLREAITLSNTLPGSKIIEFNIPGPNPHTINLASGLPFISTPVWIFGDTQPGYAGTPVIDVNGAGAASSAGLVINANSSQVYGLVIRGFPVDGIQIAANNVWIQRNYIGTNAAGTAMAGNGIAGVYINGHDDNLIDDNLIGGNAGSGIEISGADSNGNDVRSNYIGRNRAGTPLPNGVGIFITGSSHDNDIGSSSLDGNHIASNTGDGILVQGASAVNNTITENSSEGNGGAGIDLVASGNHSLGAPTITSTTATGVSGTLPASCTGCRVEVFSSPTNSDCEGRDFWAPVTASGTTWSISTTHIPSGPYITATVTNTTGDTSPFSPCVLAFGATPPLTFHPNVDISRDCYTPHCVTGFHLNAWQPSNGMGLGDLSVRMGGSEWFPSGAPPTNTPIGSAIVKVGGTVGVVTLAGPAPCCNPFVVRMGSAAESMAGKAPWTNGLSISGAPKIVASDVHAFLEDGSEVVTDITGLGFAYIVNYGGGVTGLEFGADGAGMVALEGAGVLSVDFELFGSAGGFTIHRNAAGSGYYPAIAQVRPARDPYRPQPKPAKPISSPGLATTCVFIGYDNPYGVDDAGTHRHIDRPAASDVDDDCLANSGAGLAGANESALNDGNPDLDNNFMRDGYEALCNTSQFVSDPDGDTFGDTDECIAGTSQADGVDGDGVADDIDNCPRRVANAPQLDLNDDGIGDDCDRDNDGDGIPDRLEITTSLELVSDNPATVGVFENTWNCKYAGAITNALNPNNADTDGDGVRDGAECEFGSNGGNALSIPEICDGNDNDLDGLFDEAAVLARVGFKTGICSDPDNGGLGDGLIDPGSNGPFQRGLGDEAIAGTCRLVGGPALPAPPADLAMCTNSTSIYQNDPDGDAVRAQLDDDSDNDGLLDGIEVKNYGTSPVLQNTDADACRDNREVTGGHLTGGQRDPLDSNDFFDTPVPVLLPSSTSGVTNNVVTIGDVIAIVAYIGAANNGGPNANLADYDSDLNNNGVEDGREYDRQPSNVGGQPWRSRAPNGVVTIADALTALNQVGDNCS